MNVFQLLLIIEVCVKEEADERREERNRAYMHYNNILHRDMIAVEASTTIRLGAVCVLKAKFQNGSSHDRASY